MHSNSVDLESNEKRRPCRLIVLCAATTLALCLLAYTMSSNTANPISQDAPSKKEMAQVLSQPMVMAMGMDSLNKAYNLLRGQGAAPEIAQSIGQFTTKARKKIEYGGTVYLEPDQVDVTMDSRCYQTKKTESFFRTFSIAEARSEAKQSQFNFDSSVKATYSKDPFGGKAFKASGGVDVSLFWSNSQAMKYSQKMSGKHMGIASSSFSQSILFSTFVDWRPFENFKFSTSFLSSIRNLNRHLPTPLRQKLVMEFFERYGTHVIRRASYGSRCTMTMFMQSHTKKSEVKRFTSEARKSDMSVRVWAEVEKGGAGVSASAKTRIRKSYKRTSEYAGTFGSGRKFEIGNVRCEGAVTENVCNRQLNGDSDNPVMISYETIPIWTIQGAGFTPTVIANFQHTLNEIAHHWKLTILRRCRNAGAPAMTKTFWETVGLGQYRGGFAHAFGVCVPKAGPTFQGPPPTMYAGNHEGGFPGQFVHGNVPRWTHVQVNIPHHLNPTCAHPRAFVAFSRLEFEMHRNPRLIVHEARTDNRPMIPIIFHTWSNTMTWAGGAGFLKFCRGGEFRVGVVQGTGHIRPGRHHGPRWILPFPPHCRHPRIFFGLRGLDVPHFRDMRIWTDILHGNSVRVRSWGDSEIYSAQINYLTFCAERISVRDVQTGWIQTPRPHNRNHGPLASGTRHYTVFVQFPHTMRCVPRMSAVFTGLHMWDQRNQHVKVVVTRVSHQSADITFIAWGPSLVFHASASWFATCL